MFTPEERARVKDRVLALARGDARIIGGAVTGSASIGTEDRWSDIDLSFGVADGVEPADVLTEWTELLARELDVVHHWEVRSGTTIYRVFLLPGGLELEPAGLRIDEGDIDRFRGRRRTGVDPGRRGAGETRPDERKSRDEKRGARPACRHVNPPNVRGSPT